MKCPKCYGKIDKKTKRCKSCGFNMNSFNGATHGAVKQARKDGFGDDVLYTSELPPDISKKKLILFCVFLGFMGGHSYYSGKLIKALYSTISFVFVTFTAIMNIVFGHISAVLGYFGTWLGSFSYLFMGFNIVLFIVDLVAICTNKYKVSVYKDEFSD